MKAEDMISGLTTADEFSPGILSALREMIAIVEERNSIARGVGSSGDLQDQLTGLATAVGLFKKYETVMLRLGSEIDAHCAGKKSGHPGEHTQGDPARKGNV